MFDLMSDNRLLFVFVDGIGLGDDAEYNPLASADTPTLQSLLGGSLTALRSKFTEADIHFGKLDACLGVTGLPQSATGQASLLTGKNAAVHMGRHYGPYPGPTVKKLLEHRTLFHDLPNSTLANVYPPHFQQRARLNAVVYAAVQAGLSLGNFEDYQHGRAISADLTGDYLAKVAGASPKTPFAMGEQLAQLAQEQAFTLFDFWLSDEAGHRWTLADARALVTRLDAFLAGVLSARKNLTVLLTSDHGNLEDKTRKTHTRAEVPLIVVGDGAPVFANATSLTDIAPAVRRFFTQQPAD
jgi:hypothetical protein